MWNTCVFPWCSVFWPAVTLIILSLTPLQRIEVTTHTHTHTHHTHTHTHHTHTHPPTHHTHTTQRETPVRTFRQETWVTFHFCFALLRFYTPVVLQEVVCILFYFFILDHWFISCINTHIFFSPPHNYGNALQKVSIVNMNESYF